MHWSNRRCIVLFFSSVICLLPGSTITAQQRPVAPPDISKWDLICFCITSVNTPHFAVRADTNGQILYYAQNGATKAQLEQAMGARVLMSQLDLLQDWRLLKRNGDAYTTNIPVLGPEKVGELRRQMKNLASQIVPEIRPEVQKIAAELQQRRLPDHLYSVLFSYVLDGQTWDQLRSSKAIPEMRITANHPFWDGTFWALYPNRTAEPGTDSTGPDGITLLMTWTDTVLRQLHALQNAPKLTSMLQQASRGDCRNLSIEDAEHKQWTLSGPDGACIFPVIHENASDAIYKAGEQIAKRIARAVLENDQQKLIGGGATVQQAHLIAAHELVWEVLDVIVREGMVQEPSVLRNGAASTTSLGPLLIVTVQNP